MRLVGRSSRLLPLPQAHRMQEQGEVQAQLERALLEKDAVHTRREVRLRVVRVWLRSCALSDGCGSSSPCELPGLRVHRYDGSASSFHESIRISIRSICPFCCTQAHLMAELEAAQGQLAQLEEALQAQSKALLSGAAFEDSC